MAWLKDSTSTRELLQTFDRSRSSNVCIMSDLPGGTRILLLVPGALGTITGLPETWFLITRIGWVRSGLRGGANTVVSATRCTTEYAESLARAMVDN